MSGRASRFTFLLVSWIEGLAFRASRLVALPAWLFFRFASPKNDQLNYGALLSMTSRFQPAPKPTPEEVRRHQIKWANRVARIANLYSSNNILEVGCGRGIAAHHLQEMGFRVYATDIARFLDFQVQNARLKFSVGDVRCLPYPDNQFDLVFSINSFEHFDPPEIALDEMLRVTRPGGLIYLTFDPLYYSPWGLHASRRLGMPYPQILFAEETIQRFVDEKHDELAPTYSEGANTTRIGPYLNHYSLGQYRALFAKRRASLRLLFYIERISCDGLVMIIRYSELFKARVPSFEDLIVSGIKLLGMKR